MSVVNSNETEKKMVKNSVSVDIYDCKGINSKLSSASSQRSQKTKRLTRGNSSNLSNAGSTNSGPKIVPPSDPPTLMKKLSYNRRQKNRHAMSQQLAEVVPDLQFVEEQYSHDDHDVARESVFTDYTRDISLDFTGKRHGPHNNKLTPIPESPSNFQPSNDSNEEEMSQLRRKWTAKMMLISNKETVLTAKQLVANFKKNNDLSPKRDASYDKLASPQTKAAIRKNSNELHPKWESVDKEESLKMRVKNS